MQRHGSACCLILMRNNWPWDSVSLESNLQLARAKRGVFLKIDAIFSPMSHGHWPK